jgi:hypothetical protein
LSAFPPWFILDPLFNDSSPTGQGQNPAVKTQTKQQQALSSAADDASYILQPLIGSVTSPALASAVERIMRMSLTDAGLPVSQRDGVRLRGTTVQAEAKRIAAKLIERGNVRLQAAQAA